MLHVGVEAKMGGGTVGTPPKWMVYNLWFQAYFSMDDLGVFPLFFGNIHMCARV